MNIQTGIVLALVIAATAYFVRSLLQGMTAKGCASGCGGCASSTCALQKAEVVRERTK
jgi:hypothetical protein